MKKLIALIILFLPSIGLPATYNLGDCYQATVSAAFSGANPGDVFVCPEGTFTGWTSGITVPSNVTWYGSGSGSDPGSNTIISSSSYLTHSVSSNSVVHDLRFTNGNMHYGISQSPTNFVVKDCYFGNTTGGFQSINYYSDTSPASGVYHGCEFVGLRVVNGGQYNDTGMSGFNTEDNFTASGSDRYANTIYWEDCTWTGIGNTPTSDNMYDSEMGARQVFRMSTFNGNYPRQHSWSVNRRGTRIQEMYMNTINLDYHPQVYYFSAEYFGGIAIHWGNNCIGTDGTECKIIFGDEDNSRSCPGSYDTTPHPDSGTDTLCRDSIGSGKDDSLSASMGSLENQSASASYLFLNTRNGSGAEGILPQEWSAAHISEFQDVFVDSDGAGNLTGGGVRSGLYANIGVCGSGQKGFGYWATDKGGDWCGDSEEDCPDGDDQDGALYVCDGAGSWNLYYVPALFPHLLVRSLEASAEICNNGTDDDIDGYTDCADSDCDQQTGPNGETCEYGTELSCNDGYDNDRDEREDILDSDCGRLGTPSGGGFAIGGTIP